MSQPVAQQSRVAHDLGHEPRKPEQDEGEPRPRLTQRTEERAPARGGESHECRQQRPHQDDVSLGHEAETQPRAGEPGRRAARGEAGRAGAPASPAPNHRNTPSWYSSTPIHKKTSHPSKCPSEAASGESAAKAAAQRARRGSSPAARGTAQDQPCRQQPGEGCRQPHRELAVREHAQRHRRRPVRERRFLQVQDAVEARVEEIASPRHGGGDGRVTPFGALQERMRRKPHEPEQHERCRRCRSAFHWRAGRRNIRLRVYTTSPKDCPRMNTGSLM